MDTSGRVLNFIVMELDLEAKEEFEQKFKVISLLGKGSFGFVYECYDKVDGQVYAVKVMPSSMQVISKTNVKKSKI
jgi:serine/threonine protein kinase